MRCTRVVFNRPIMVHGLPGFAHDVVTEADCLIRIETGPTVVLETAPNGLLTIVPFSNVLSIAATPAPKLEAANDNDTPSPDPRGPDGQKAAPAAPGRAAGKAATRPAK